MAGRYTIEEEIGKGGEGSVHKAFDTQLKRHVALKRVLTTDRATAEEVDKAADNLIAEAEALASLNHPNIVTVFDVGKDEEGGFVVMELLNGETLDDTVARGVLTQEDFKEVVIQTMEALIAAQAINVVHRDLKPTNVMVIWQPSGRFQTKILDFGLAKFSKSPSVQTMGQDESVMGSIYFMAPEQFERAELDERTDLYSMGCVYYHSLTGLYPFRGETAPLVMNSHLQHRVTPLDKLRPDLAPSVCQWVMWLINRDIDNRPDNASMALEHFPQNPEMPEQQVLQAIPVEEAPTGMTTGVQAVVATHAAEAPTGMVVLENETGSRPVMGYPGGVAPSKSSGKGKMVALGIVAAAALGAGGWVVKEKLDDGARRTRLVELASKDIPSGAVADVKMVMHFISSKKSTPSQRSSAKKVLSSLEGRGVDKAVLDELKNAKTSYQRMVLSQALATRDYEEAVPAILKAFELERKDQVRLEILNALRLLVTTENIEPVLEDLKKEYTLQIRVALENLVVAAFRRVSATKENLKPLTDRLDKAEGTERRSLWRILGARGGGETLGRLKRIFIDEKHDEAYLRDAMIGLANLPTIDNTWVIARVYSNSKDEVLLATAKKAYIRSCTIPSRINNNERKSWWSTMLKASKKPQDINRLFAAMSDYTSPEIVKFIEDRQKEKVYAPYAKAALAKIAELEKEAPILESGQLLPAHRQVLRSDGADFDPEDQAITRWVKPESWFVFHFKIKEAGEYQVEVSQSLKGGGKNEFSIYLDEKKLTGVAIDTDDWDEYKSNKLKNTVKLEANKTYALFLKAGGVVQPRMMNIRGIRLQKK
ncbi:MAG: protein kinase [Verrucomicrobiales bacterium]|nr:protein kinase [Verrucomicrobiales bacterium]